MVVPYEISYGKKIKKRRIQKRKFYIIPMTLAAWLGFVVLVNNCWPEGRAVLREFLIPEALESAAAAIDGFVFELRSGEAFPEALQTFCQEIIERVD